MSNENEMELTSLGTVLKHARDSKKLSIDQVAAETRISVSNLRAMENDDYDNLPAIPFARGFYGLYAKFLGLDPDEITNRFLQNIGSTPKKESQRVEDRDHNTSSQDVSTMAERSIGSPMSTFGFTLLLIIILAGALCYYFQINPATYLSEKLRSFQKTEVSQTDLSEPSDSDTLPNQ